MPRMVPGQPPLQQEDLPVLSLAVAFSLGFVAASVPPVRDRVQAAARKVLAAINDILN